jgi:hypothetical protein
MTAPQTRREYEDDQEGTKIGTSITYCVRTHSLVGNELEL